MNGLVGVMGSPLLVGRHIVSTSILAGSQWHVVSSGK